MEVVAGCLAALYLRGLGARAVRRRWPLVLGCLRVASVSSHREAVAALRAEGLDDEASALCDERVWERAICLLEGRQVLTAACEGYPRRWRLALGSGAPAAVWASGLDFGMASGGVTRLAHGVVGGLDGMVVGMVGSRTPSLDLLRAVGTCASEIAALANAHVVSGGALGVDQAASSAMLGHGVRVTEVLPCGVDPDRRQGDFRQFSVNPAGSPFGAWAAMERNTLIYAMVDVAVVFGPRLRSGGTWHGAIEALRRRLCRVLVCFESDNLGARALVALGAEWYDPELGLAHALAQPMRQPSLPLAEPW